MHYIGGAFKMDSDSKQKYKIDAHSIDNTVLTSEVYCGDKAFVLATPRWDHVHLITQPVHSNGPKHLVEAIKEIEKKEWDEYTFSNFFSNLKSELFNRNYIRGSVNFFGALKGVLDGTGAALDYGTLFKNKLPGMSALDSNVQSFLKSAEELAETKKHQILAFLEAGGVKDPEKVLAVHVENIKAVRNLYSKNDFNYETEASMLIVPGDYAEIHNAGANRIFRVREGQAEDLGMAALEKEIKEKQEFYSEISTVKALAFLNEGILGHNSPPFTPSLNTDLQSGDVFILAAKPLIERTTSDGYGYKYLVGVSPDELASIAGRDMTAEEMAERIDQSYKHSVDYHGELWSSFRLPVAVVKIE